MKLTSLEDLEDRLIGKIGTPDRDEYERQLREDLQAYHIGEAIKNARLAQHLTQEELGDKIGVKKAQISRIERGHNITVTSMGRIFKALGISRAFLDLGVMGRVALW